MATQPTFRGGRNIALKLPPPVYEPTLAFYRDVLGLRQIEQRLPSIVFEFGANQLWLDRVPGLSQAEAWLEVVTDDLDAATERLRAAGIVRRDEIEPLPDGFQGFWIASPAQLIHLVCSEAESR